MSKLIPKCLSNAGNGLNSGPKILDTDLYKQENFSEIARPSYNWTDLGILLSDAGAERLLRDGLNKAIHISPKVIRLPKVSVVSGDVGEESYIQGKRDGERTIFMGNKPNNGIVGNLTSAVAHEFGHHVDYATNNLSKNMNSDYEWNEKMYGKKRKLISDITDEEATRWYNTATENLSYPYFNNKEDEQEYIDLHNYETGNLVDTTAFRKLPYPLLGDRMKEGIKGDVRDWYNTYINAAEEHDTKKSERYADAFAKVATGISPRWDAMHPGQKAEDVKFF